AAREVASVRRQDAPRRSAPGCVLVFPALGRTRSGGGHPLVIGVLVGDAGERPGCQEVAMRGLGRTPRGAVVLAAMLALPLAACTQPAAPAAPAGPGAPVVLATELEAPWSVVRLEDGGALISQRDDGRVIELTASGDQREAGSVPGVVS